MPIAVVTSKKARERVADITATHSDLVQGINLQSQKRQMNEQVKASAMANEQSMGLELEKEKMQAATQTNRDALTFAQKQSEIDVKRAALAAE